MSTDLLLRTGHWAFPKAWVLPVEQQVRCCSDRHQVPKLFPVYIPSVQYGFLLTRVVVYAESASEHVPTRLASDVPITLISPTGRELTHWLHFSAQRDGKASAMFRPDDLALLAWEGVHQPTLFRTFFVYVRTPTSFPLINILIKCKYYLLSETGSQLLRQPFLTGEQHPNLCMYRLDDLVPLQRAGCMVPLSVHRFTMQRYDGLYGVSFPLTLQRTEDSYEESDVYRDDIGAPPATVKAYDVCAHEQCPAVATVTCYECKAARCDEHAQEVEVCGQCTCELFDCKLTAPDALHCYCLDTRLCDSLRCKVDGCQLKTATVCSPVCYY